MRYVCSVAGKLSCVFFSHVSRLFEYIAHFDTSAKHNLLSCLDDLESEILVDFRTEFKIKSWHLWYGISALSFYLHLLLWIQIVLWYLWLLFHDEYTCDSAVTCWELPFIFLCSLHIENVHEQSSGCLWLLVEMSSCMLCPVYKITVKQHKLLIGEQPAFRVINKREWIIHSGEQQSLGELHTVFMNRLGINCWSNVFSIFQGWKKSVGHSVDWTLTCNCFSKIYRQTLHAVLQWQTLDTLLLSLLGIQPAKR